MSIFAANKQKMAKEFKRSSKPKGRSEKPEKSEKGARGGKRDDKPGFNRYRDDSRPSDFGSRKAAPRSPERTERRPKPDFKRDRKEDDQDQKPKKERSSFGEKKPFEKREKKSFGGRSEKRSFKENKEGKKEVNAFDMDESDLDYDKPKPTYQGSKGQKYIKKPYVKKKFTGKGPSKTVERADDGTIRLNKYLSNAGICSRREADDLIASGVVQVNGKTITEMGFRVKATDVIRYGGQTLKKERLVYLILNKPKDYLTTVDDPQKRRTVLELVADACRERIYPVGRLDRSTTGLLMFTNDGELTKKMTHPRYGVRKIYHVELDKVLKRSDMDKIAEGIELEDGPIKVDEISYVGDGSDKKEIGVEIHSGKNRVVRRIFESLGYNVRKLDRVMFGPLTKKDLSRGRWRFLTDAEVGMLKMIGAEKENS